MFFHVQINGALLSTQTHLFGIGHEKHPFGYVMDFEIFLKILCIVKNYKVHHIIHIFQIFYF